MEVRGKQKEAVFDVVGENRQEVEKVGILFNGGCAGL